MIKWIKGHIKQILACVAVFVISFTVFMVGVFAIDITNTTSPHEMVPLVPVFNEQGDDRIFVQDFKYSNTEEYIYMINPVAQFKLNCQSFNSNVDSYIQEDFPLSFSMKKTGITASLDSYNVKLTGAVSTLNLKVVPKDISKDNSIGSYYTYDCHLGSKGITDNVVISAEPFWYVPYELNDNKYYNDTICEIVLYESHYLSDPTAFEISGTFYYYGNVITGHDFSYVTSTTELRQVKVSYRDIVTSADYGDDESYIEAASNTCVPIFISDLKISSTDGEIYYDGGNLDFTVSCRYQTVGDFNCDLVGDNTMVYYNTVDNSRELFQFDWLVDAIESFFEAEFFGYVTLGGLAFSVIALIFVLGVFKLIKGI